MSVNPYQSPIAVDEPVEPRWHVVAELSQYMLLMTVLLPIVIGFVAHETWNAGKRWLAVAGFAFSCGMAVVVWVVAPRVLYLTFTQWSHLL